MQAEGVIGKYAIGGAVGATLYLEPAATLDVDIFVAWPVTPGSSFLSLTPLYDFLKSRGGRVVDEHIVVDDCQSSFFRQAVTWSGKRLSKRLRPRWKASQPGSCQLNIWWLSP